MFHRYRFTIAACVLVLLAATVAGATTDTIVIQPGPEDGCDTYVAENTAGANHGEETTMYFGGIPGAGEVRLYIRFDLTAVGPGSLVNDASLQLYMYGQNGFMDTFDYGVYRVTAPWAEGMLTWNNQPACAETPEVIFPGSNWQAAYYQWHDLGSLAAVVQDWVEHPDQNFGLVIKPVSGYYGNPYIWSSEYSTDPTLRPRLVVSGGLVSGEAESWSAIKGLYR